jgi:selenophosphate synthetase-related protein
VAAIDLRGRMHGEHPFWDASSGADPARLRGDLEVLPRLAEAEICDAAKDISMAGVAGTLLMLIETSGVGATLDVDRVPRPPEVPIERWVSAFPSFGFLLSVRPDQVAAVQAAFAARAIDSAVVGAIDASRRLTLRRGGEACPLWDLAAEPLTGFGGAPP